MNKSQKWMEIIKRFSNTGETGRCPDCGYEEKLEVIITDDGIGSVTFHCKHDKKNYLNTYSKTVQMWMK